MRRLRISAISYLNTAPLLWDFEHSGASSGFDVSYTLPSQCAANLRDGAAEIGIIPAAAYASVPGLRILPGVAIASRQAVRSILLVSKLALRDVRTVALDTSSMTSVALTKVLFEKWLGGARTYTSMSPDIVAMLRENDAALLIGDPALQLDRTGYLTHDLAEEWNRRTGKPFVFAFWAIREAALTEIESTLDLAGIFQRSRDHGIAAQNLNRIIAEWAPRLQLPEELLRTYLTQNIYYYLDDACLEGMHLFYQYARELSILPAAPPLRFLSSQKLAEPQTVT